MIAVLMVVAACAPRGAGLRGVFRNASSPIYSIASFDQRRLEGKWDQVAVFASQGALGCKPGAVDFTSQPTSVKAKYQLCLSVGEVIGGGSIEMTGPGRFSVSGKDGLDQDWWVLWVDESYRTMAIGNPSGAFGFILNRGRALPADRLKAATEVFDFNGYDTTKLSVLR